MNLKKENLYKECFRILLPVFLIATLEKGIIGVVSIFTASTLGGLTDAILALNSTHSVNNAITLLLLMFIIIVIVPIFQCLQNILMLKLSLQHDAALIHRFFQKSYSSVSAYEIGEITFRLERDPVDFRYYFIEILSRGILFPVLFGIAMWQAIKINLLFGVLTIVIATLSLLLPIFVQKLEGKYDRDIRDYRTNVKNTETEFAENLGDIIILNLVPRYLDIFMNKFLQFFCKTGKRNNAYKSVTEQIQTFVRSFSMVLVLIFGAMLCADNRISGGAIATMMGYLSTFQMFLGDMGFIIQHIPIIKNLSERMMIFNTDIVPEQTYQINDWNALTADGITFSYDKEPLLHNICFCVEQGNSLSITGGNGCGKTTLLEILSGLLDGYEGHIKIGENVFYRDTAYQLLGQISYAPQQPFLFSGTVRENIALGNPEVDKEALEMLIQEAGLSAIADVTVLPSGENLSGGEKQKVSICRAILKNSPIILLDEPTNDIDTEGRSWVKSYLNNASKLCVVVTHDDDIMACTTATLSLDNMDESAKR